MTVFHLMGLSHLDISSVLRQPSYVSALEMKVGTNMLPACPMRDPERFLCMIQEKLITFHCGQSH